MRRERLRQEAEQRRASQPHREGQSIIDEFNQNNSIADLFTLYGYEQSPRHSEDWRSPLQSSESYATRIIEGKWVSLSASDAGAGLGERCKSGCFGDAYDLYAHFEHGGDHKAAHRALYAERRASQPQAAPPPREEGDPGWQEMPDAPDEPELMIEAQIEQIEAPRDITALPLEWAGQAEPVIDGFWLVEDWLPQSGIAAIYGHPGSGKSFFALDLAAAIASGRPWAGKHVERGLVVYVVAEGATGFRNRMFAMRQNGDIAPDAPLAYIATPIDMQAPDGDVMALIETIRQAVDQSGQAPAMIVLDTLSKTFGAGKENTDDMVGYINNCQRVASAFDCLTCVVHHRPKDSESRDMRGHSSLRGNVDTTILVEAGDIKTATTLKQKDGEDNLQVRFRLNRVVIGTDRRGKEVSTCLVEITDEQPIVEKSSGLAPLEKRAYNDLMALVGNRDVDPETGEKGVVSTPILSSGWRDAMRLSGTISGTNEDSARRLFYRYRKALERKGIIEVQGDYVVVLGQGGTA
jgi:KaiC/GvpD/RAD55 family RecA-like ATPase